MAKDNAQSIVIVGCGIIGLSTAYHLLALGHPGSQLHIVEASPELFSGASGYSGGFLASNWYSSSVLALGRLSFSLHRELAERHDGRQKWAYSPSTGISLGADYTGGVDDDEEVEGAADWLLQGTSRAQVADRNDKESNRRSGEDDEDVPAWLKVGKRQKVEVLSRGDSTAQVDPLRLCEFLLSYCRSEGVTLHQPATATRLVRDDAHVLTGLELTTGTTITCTSLVLTAGPWTTKVFEALFPASATTYKKLQVHPLAGHSIIVRSPHFAQASNADFDSESEPLGVHAVFATSLSTSQRITGSPSFAPEIFSRYPDQIYIAGLNSSSAALPKRSDLSEIDEQSIEALKEAARRLIKLKKGEELRSAAEEVEVEVVRAGHCFRPATDSGRPFIAKIPSSELQKDCSLVPGGGVFVSAGHGPWGISLSQGTGYVLAELILGKKPSVPMKPYML